LVVQIIPADEPLATLVLIPGGLGSSRDFMGQARNVDGLVEAGFTVVLLDLDGRGISGGEEDYGGHIHQDGLAEVIRAAAAHPSVDPARIGVASVSYGITTASGALARHADLGVMFLIDWEGPANRDDTGGCGGDEIGWLNREISCDDEAYWSEREPSTSMRAVPVPYLRLQSERDHVQPDNSHAVILVNAATEGASPWTRLNDLEPNMLYDPDSPPLMLAEGLDRDLMQLLETAAIDMVGLHG
jgi:pimeloyl-ACP methyl ester carboxylesterase